MEYTIRKTQPEDFDQIFDIWLQGQKAAIGSQITDEKIESMKKDMSRSVFDPESHYFVAVGESGDILGWHSHTPIFNHPFLHKIIAQTSTYIHENFRGMNLGISLFIHGYKHALSIGIEQLYGWIGSNNKVARRLIEQFNPHFSDLPASALGNVPEFVMYIIDVTADHAILKWTKK